MILAIENEFASINLPFQYLKFENRQSLPYVVYIGDGSSNLKADNKTYNSDNNYLIEYYFDKKSETKEKEIEGIFDKLEIAWEKSEDIYIQSENMSLIRYYI